MLIVMKDKVINLDNITDIEIEKDYTSKGQYTLKAYDNLGENAFTLGTYKTEEDAQIELSRFINSYKEEKRIHRFEGE
jgi:hypothetical protein